MLYLCGALGLMAKDWYGPVSHYLVTWIEIAACRTRTHTHARSTPPSPLLSCINTVCSSVQLFSQIGRHCEDYVTRAPVWFSLLQSEGASLQGFSDTASACRSQLDVLLLLQTHLDSLKDVHTDWRSFFGYDFTFFLLSKITTFALTTFFSFVIRAAGFVCLMHCNYQLFVHVRVSV